jgi:endo-1,4-beta-xylanase
MKKMFILCMIVVLSTAIHAQTGASNESLIQLARKVRPDFYLGSFYSGLNPKGSDNDELKAIFRKNFNIITVGIYMQSIQRDQDKYNLELVDYLVDYANANKIKVYFHPLFGGATYCPEWLRKGTFTKAELEKIMRDRITTILTRYSNKVQYVDVVNEALASGNMTADGEFDWRTEDRNGAHPWMKMGMYQGKKYKFPQYFVDAFRISREVGGKNLRLVLNEYDNQATVSPKGKVFFELIKAMKEEGIPVDDAGIQLHCRIRDGKFYEWGNTLFDFDSFDAMLKKYEEAGINVHITEFDIHLPEKPTEADFQLQGKCYGEILKHAIKSPAVKTFKTWGFTDRHSWHAGGIDGHPLLFDENLKPKPAYLQQVEVLKSLKKVK